MAVGARHGVLTDDGQTIDRLIDRLVARTPSVIGAVAARLLPGFPERVADTIFRGLSEAAKRLGA